MCPEITDMRALLVLVLLATGACSDLSQTGRAPALTPVQAGVEHSAMVSYGIENELLQTSLDQGGAATLWTGGRGSLWDDRRAMTRGDILTVVIEINDSAQISNSSDRSRSGNQSMSVPSLMGLPQRIDQSLPEGASMGDAVGLNSASTFSGDGSVSRNEKLTLRIAATIIDVLPNGVLSLQGSQEVRVNNELRELLVSGFVRPEDITRQNEIFYDKIASARISYGGRGHISEFQEPRYGQQLLDNLLPF